VPLYVEAAPRSDVADLTPNDPALTGYDEEHLVTYLRMLDTNADGADWREVSLIVLHIDPGREPDRVRRAFDGHLARARWMSDSGCKQLLRRDWGAMMSLTSRAGATRAASASRWVVTPAELAGTASGRRIDVSDLNG
jgi:hypothetical protein